MSLVIDRALEGLEKLVGEDATCESIWPDSNGVACGKPAHWIVSGHSIDGHRYVPSRMCDPCLEKAKGKGFTSPFIKCGDCGAIPIIKDIRPI